ncbi:hypothetical protein L9F63_023216, partial [Diploptera punctata]
LDCCNLWTLWAISIQSGTGSLVGTPLFSSRISALVISLGSPFNVILNVGLSPCGFPLFYSVSVLSWFDVALRRCIGIELSDLANRRSNRTKARRISSLLCWRNVELQIKRSLAASNEAIRKSSDLGRLLAELDSKQAQTSAAE